MAITIKKTPLWTPGQGLTMSGTGPGLSVRSSGGGGGGPLDPTGVSGLKLRYNVLSGYSNIASYNDGEMWTATVAPGSANPTVYTYGGATMKSTDYGAEPNFNGYGSIWSRSSQPSSTFTPYNSDNYLDIPGGISARTIYLVGMIPTIPSGTKELFGYGRFNTYGMFMLSISNGRLIARCDSANNVLNPYDGPVTWNGSTYQAPPAASKATDLVTAGVPFVVSYAYIEGSNMKDNDIYLNGVAGNYGTGTGYNIWGVTQGHGDYNWGLTGVIGNTGFTRFSSRLEYVYNTDCQYYAADVLIFDSAHDATTREGIESWLMTRYGISA